MQSRPIEHPPAFVDIVLRWPRNWTAAGFLGLLGLAHLTNAVLTILGGRWQCYLSVAFGAAFLSLAALAVRFRSELAVLSTQRRLRLRTGVGPLRAERSIPFADVRGVRLTLGHGGGREGSTIELLCDLESIECPPTPIPRQEALLLAMAMDVPLIKATDEPPAVDPLDRVSDVPVRS